MREATDSPMTIFDPPRRFATRAVLATLLTGGCGVLSLSILAAAGGAPAGPSAAAAGLMAVATAALIAWQRVGVGASNSDAVARLTEGEALEPPYALMLESLPDPVILASAGEHDDVGGGARLLFANAAARGLMRLQRPGGLLAAAIRHPLVLEAIEEALFGRIESSTLFDEGGARDRTWRAVAKPLPSQDGKNLALLWMRDETDARRNERMRADFLANASHELRTPLASLAGFVETLRGHAKDDPAARDRFLAIMTQQADRMARLIDDLLSLSRIELNEHIAPSGLVDLRTAVTDVLDGLGPLASDRGVRLDQQLGAPGRAMVTGDRDQILQVIQNLVDNAIKYAGKDGAVTVEIATGISADRAMAPRLEGGARLSLLSPDRAHDEHFASIRVSDTGPGIAREHLPRLSERFYRVEGQKSGERAGTGLGLAIVKHIVNRHRGGLSVESGEGQGSAFTAYLPMARTDAAIEAPVALS